MTCTVHRLIERHAAIKGDAIAVIDGESSCSYRELNAAANVMARRLMAAGFRRGMHAQVRMTPSVDLAVVLLAILKAGGCYTWIDDQPAALRREPAIRIDEWEHWELPIGEVPAHGVCGANLPVVTRETEIACVLDSQSGGGSIAVPHATIVAMTAMASSPGRSAWAGETGAFDLWVALMTGATAVVDERPAVAA